MGKSLLVPVVAASVLVPLHEAGDEVAPHSRPALVHRTHVGGSNTDGARDVCADESGATFVAGWTRSLDFPEAAPRSPEDGRDALVFKLSPDGRALEWSLALGGRGDDEAVALALTPEGDLVVAGTTHSPDFPTTRNAHDRTFSGGMDAWVARISASGTLQWSTLLGGKEEDELADLALSTVGVVTVTGTTRSLDFARAEPGSVRSPTGRRDVFVARLDARGENLLFATRLGGSQDDHARALAVDADGACYVAGRTDSHDFPTTLAAVDRTKSSLDAFVLKLSGGGRSLVWSTFLGGSGQDEALGLALDGKRRALVVGWTQSSDFPFPAGTTAAGRKDGFVVAVSSSGNALEFATPLGGGSADEAVAVDVDAQGELWVVGRTRSHDFAPGLRGLGGVADGFAVALDAQGAARHAELFGGAGEDGLGAVFCEAAGGSIVFAGSALDIVREERGELSGSSRGPSDALLVRLDPRARAPRTPDGVMRAGLGF
jgi:hypothetical protein